MLGVERSEVGRLSLRGRTGGSEGNRRLTGSTAALLLVLLAAEGATVISIRPLVSVHVFLGMLLLPPVGLKIATTGYRFVRYSVCRDSPPPIGGATTHYPAGGFGAGCSPVRSSSGWSSRWPRSTSPDPGVSIVGLPLVLALVLIGRRESTPLRAVGWLVARRMPESDPVAETVKLASAALVFLVAQESLERSVELHRVALAGFAPATWAVLLAAAVAVAGAVLWLGRAVASLVEGILDVRRSADLRPTRVLGLHWYCWPRP